MKAVKIFLGVAAIGVGGYLVYYHLGGGKDKSEREAEAEAAKNRLVNLTNTKSRSQLGLL